MIEEAIYQLAKAHAGLTALIGTGDNIRFYPDGQDIEGAVPRVVWSSDSSVPVAGIWSDSGWSHTTFTFTAFATTAKGAKDVIDQVRACFQRYHSNGAVVGTTAHKIDDVEATGDVFADYDHDLGQFYEMVELEFFHS